MRSVVCVPVALLAASLLGCGESDPSSPRHSSPVDHIPPEGLIYVLSRVADQTEPPFITADLRYCANGAGRVADVLYDSVYFHQDGTGRRALVSRLRDFPDGVEDPSSVAVFDHTGNGGFLRIENEIHFATTPLNNPNGGVTSVFRIQGDDLVRRQAMGGRCGDGSYVDARPDTDFIYTLVR